MLTSRSIFCRVRSSPICQHLGQGRDAVISHARNVSSSSQKLRHPQHREQQTKSPPPSSYSRTRRPLRRYVSKLYQNFGKMQPQDLGLCHSYKLMLYNEVISPCHPGAFHLLPLGQRAMEKLIRIIDQEMEAVGGQKISMPTLAPEPLWRASGRWELTGKELFSLHDRHGLQFCLGPTHEELITSLVAAQSPIPNQHLPQLLYQITRKFRDEMNPKHGLLRGREFEMKDMYSFDADEESAMKTYNAVCDAYSNIFDRIGVPFVKVQGSTGNIGGTLSHEFHYPAEVGEDRLLLCLRCGLKMNEEIMSDEENLRDICPEDSEECHIEEHKGIEVGHCFYLGTKYSSVFSATYTDDMDKVKPIHMGCFGLGVTRILQATIEVLSKERQLRWPSLIAPYQVCLIPQKEGFQSEVYFRLAEELSDELSSLPNMSGEVVIDDRTKFSIGRRLYEASRLGYPCIVVLGKKALAQPCQLEVINTASGETQFMSREQLIDFLSSVETI